MDDSRSGEEPLTADQAQPVTRNDQEEQPPDPEQITLDHLYEQESSLPQELKQMLRRLRKGKRLVTHTTLRFAPAIDTTAIRAVREATADMFIPAPRTGGTFARCPDCGQRHRTLSAYRRHYWRRHGTG